MKCDDLVLKADSDYMLVKLTYFKASGKYYTEGKCYAKRGLPLFRIWELLDDMLKLGKRPGLVDGCNEFTVLIDVPDHQNNHPHLIVGF